MRHILLEEMTSAIDVMHFFSALNNRSKYPAFKPHN